MDETPTMKGMDPASAAALGSGTSALSRIKSLKNQHVKSDKDIEKAAAGFEALLLHEMLKSMWETVEPSGLMGEETNQAQIYRGMFNQAIADNAAKGKGIGVKDIVKRELTKHERASEE